MFFGTSCTWSYPYLEPLSEIRIPPRRRQFRTFCSKKFRQSLLNDRFGFVCDCQACSLAGRALDKDDWCRTEIDKLAQKFAQVRSGLEIVQLPHAGCQKFDGMMIESGETVWLK